MGKAETKSFWSDFRRFFLRGLATLLPTILTILLLVKCFEFIQENIGIHINDGASYVYVVATKNHSKWSQYPALEESDFKEYIKQERPALDATNEAERQVLKNDVDERNEVRLWKLRQHWSHAPGSLIGFFLAIILVYIVGRLLASYVGRKLWRLFERAVAQIPGFKQVYPYIKQVTDYLFGENKIEFSRVVAVSYPREGVWSLGLVTGAGFKYMGEATKEEYLTVFIPSSPTPVTGYVVHVKKEDAIDLPISIEEAIRFTVSGGVIVPGHQVLPTQRIELAPGPQVGESDAAET